MLRPTHFISHTIVSGLRLLLVLLFLLPILLGVAGAFRPEGEIFQYAAQLSLYTFVPAAPTLANFAAAIERAYFVRQIINILVAAVVQSSLVVVITTLAAFALARMRFQGQAFIFFCILITLFIPFEALLVPMYLVVRDLGLLNSFAGLILPWIASPIAVFLMRQALLEIPRELDEAAIIDGAGIWGILRAVVIPNSWPIMVTVFLITFVSAWDSYLWPLVVINDPERQMVQVGIVALFNVRDRVPFGMVFASSVLAVGPVLVAFLFLQRFYVRGIALTGMK